jgi:putative DNA primase/helicase
VLVTEGPGDGLTGVSLGYDVFFIAGSGNASNPTILDALAAFAAGRKVIACGDGDRAGQQFSAAIAQGMTERSVTVARLAVPEDSDLSKWRESDPTGRAIVRAIMEAPVESSYSAALSGRDQSTYPLTDLGNARFLRDYARSQGSDLRYAPESGFFVLDGGVWRPDDLDASRAYAQEAAEMTAAIARTMAVGAVTKEQEAAAKAWRAWANYSQSSRGIDAAIREVKALRDVATPLDKFDQRHDLLACANGVVDLRTGDLLPHDPAYLLTRRIDLVYRKDAKAPRWEKFLGEVFDKHPALPAYMQRLVGYGITGRTDEQCFVVHVGKGANGKSVLTDTLTEVFREATVTTPFSTFEAKPSGGIPNDIAALKGARLVMASEGEANKPMAEAMLKRVTGRDLIAARFMRKEFFEFRPTFLIMLASNYKPQFRGQDEGLWRRVKLIPWSATSLRTSATRVSARRSSPRRRASSRGRSAAPSSGTRAGSATPRWSSPPSARIGRPRTRSTASSRASGSTTRRSAASRRPTSTSPIGSGASTRASVTRTPGRSARSTPPSKSEG